MPVKKGWFLWTRLYIYDCVGGTHQYYTCPNVPPLPAMFCFTSHFKLTILLTNCVRDNSPSPFLLTSTWHKGTFSFYFQRKKNTKNTHILWTFLYISFCGILKNPPLFPTRKIKKGNFWSVQIKHTGTLVKVKALLVCIPTQLWWQYRFWAIQRRFKRLKISFSRLVESNINEESLY